MRRIEAPGIEINEIDHSQYEVDSESNLTDTAVLVAGFANYGPDYTTNYIDNIDQFIQIYGYPTNEAERYFYYAAKEVVSRRGVLYCAKLPYYNNVSDKIAYTTYQVDNKTWSEQITDELGNNVKVVKTSLQEISSTQQLITTFPNKNLVCSAPYSDPENKIAWLDILKLTYLPYANKKQLTDKNIDDTGKKIDFNYSFFIDFFDWLFDTAALRYHYKGVYNTYFEQFNGVEYLIDLIDTEDINDTKLVEDYNLAHSYDILDDLINIRDAVINFYGKTILGEKISINSTSGNEILNTVFINFINTKTITDIYNYFVNLYNIMFDSSFTAGYAAGKEAEDTNNKIFKIRVENLAGQTDETFNNWIKGMRTCALVYKYNTDLEFKLEFDEKLEQLKNDRLQGQQYTEEKIEQLKKYLKLFYSFNSKYTEIVMADESLSSYVEVRHLSKAEGTGLIDFDTYDKMKINMYRPKNNTIMICDISRGKYKFDDDHNKEFLGIMPVITTAANAMAFQEIISNVSDQQFSDYNVISKIQTVNGVACSGPDLTAEKFYDTLDRDYLFDAELENNRPKTSISDTAVRYFPELTFTATKRLDRNYLKQIGIVVFKLVLTASGNKVTCIPVESFVGSLDRNGKDLIKNTNNFIDTIVNDSSRYINVFSNVDYSENAPIVKADILAIKDQVATSIGFYKEDSAKNIQVKYSILKALDLIHNNNNNIDKRNIDIVCDAGVSTIAQYIASTKEITVANMEERKGEYNPIEESSQKFSVIDAKHAAIWRSVITKYDNLCKAIRKDCMFIADCIRSTCLFGNEKIVRSTKLENSIIKDIIPQLTYQLNIDTSYGAGYCNWFQIKDAYSGLFFWCPPSIKATGVYIYTDIYHNSWDAPAGLNRGVLNDIYDLAFNPTNYEAGKIYKNSWNYAVQYPIDGIVLEGQRTFQINKTAFDRVNVRRLFLKMEKLVYKIAKRFCYEGNTAYVRQRFVDTITPLFEEAVIGGGISEYYIICNEKNNTTQTIENHELHCTIAIRPIKSIEFIILNFIAMPQSGSFSEDQILQLTPYYGKK